MGTMLTDTQLFCLSEAGKREGVKANDLQIVACPGAQEQSTSDLRNKYHQDVDENEPDSSPEDPDYWSMMGLVFPLHPTSLGQITLNSADPMVYPKIDYEYLQTQY